MAGAQNDSFPDKWLSLNIHDFHAFWYILLLQELCAVAESQGSERNKTRIWYNLISEKIHYWKATWDLLIAHDLFVTLSFVLFI